MQHKSANRDRIRYTDSIGSPSANTTLTTITETKPT